MYRFHPNRLRSSRRTPQTLKINAVCSFAPSGTNNSASRCDHKEYLNPLYERHSNLKSHASFILLGREFKLGGFKGQKCKC